MRTYRHFHGALLVGLVALAAGCGTLEYNAAQKATKDGSALRALGLSPEQVRYQGTCLAGVKRGTKYPTVQCIYVQTADQVNFMTYNSEKQAFEPAARFPISEFEKVALGKAINTRQVQLTHQGVTLAFYIAGVEFINSRLTEEIYGSLVAAGIRQVEPKEWYDISVNTPTTTMVIPVYVGR